MTTSITLLVLSALPAGGVVAIGQAAGSQPSSAQEWTILGLLALVVLGIGGGMVAAMKEMSAAVAKTSKDQTDAMHANTTQLQLLAQQIKQHHDEAARARQADSAALNDKIERLPGDVASELATKRKAE